MAVKRRASAADLANRQREISISEFFTKNRHLLGFDSPSKALLTAVKEAVDNSLDACEEAGILPEIKVELDALAEDRYMVTVEDNGPGIIRKQVPKIFGKLLYGSKFHRLKQSRGQQGIGISAAGMYAQLTTGKPVLIITRTGASREPHQLEVAIDTKRNAPSVLKDKEIEWDKKHGTRVTMELEAVYRKGQHSVDEYMVQTAMANPHARIEYRTPKGDEVTYERSTEELPVEAREIKPHPYGVELGILARMLRDSKSRTVLAALKSDFSRVSDNVGRSILKEAGIPEKRSPRHVASREVESLFRAIPKVKIMAPPTNCLSPIGEDAILSGMKKLVPADWYVARTRPPSVYRGNPFQVEVGLAYGGALESDGLARVIRYANRVPLLYQAGGCGITKAVLTTSWRGYGLQQARGALPSGPLVIFVHIASVWVPFTSESKEAIAHYPELLKDVRLALQECGRKLSAHIRRGKREADEHRKRTYIAKYLPYVGDALQEILSLSPKKRDQVVEQLTNMLERSRKM
ncbi:MAG: DNA topoisomerase VI subunit B [Deltaproteobacteria bacterium]|nr:DNA topoisomerase VI subunit B [Deltaproteobacteria bacterium]